MIKNKKGDIAITLLVVMILVLCLAAAFIFITKQYSYEQDMKQIKILPQTYALEDSFKFYIYNLARKTVNNNPNIDKSQFLEEFKKEYKANSIPFYLKKEYLDQIENDSNYEIIIEENTDKKVGDKILKFKLKGFTFSSSESYDPASGQEIAVVRHTQDIEFEIGF